MRKAQDEIKRKKKLKDLEEESLKKQNEEQQREKDRLK